MKCRIKKIISTASVLALTVAATPGAKLYDEAQAVLGNAASITLTAKADTISETTTWNKATTLTEDTVVDGDLTISADVDLNGFTLTVNGDLTQSAGTIACNNGMLNINGNYYLEYTSANKENYYVCYPVLNLSEESDRVNIDGDLETHRIGSGYGIIQNAGTITVSGNINAENGFTMSTNNYTVLNLNGKNDQYVNFGNCPTLNVLNITNPDKREIVWSGDMHVASLKSDIQVKPQNLNLGNINLAGYSMAVNGDCGIAKETAIDINSGTLTINGNLSQAAGTIVCNNGKLNINGNYYLEYTSADKENYYVCYPVLNLSEESDRVNIDGDLETHRIGSGYGIIQNAGTITVSGNISADNGFTMSTNNYTVLKLNGNTKQKIDLAAGTKINILVINKPLSYYEFNQENCWMELVTDYPAVVIKSWEKGNGAVKLNWDAVLGAEKYAIAGYVNGKWKVLDYGTGTSYVLKGLKPGVKYKVAVVAKIDGKWNLDVSKAVIVTPKTVNKYPVVTAEVSGKQFRLKWKPADAAEKYAIAVFQSGKWVVKVQLNSDVTSYTSPKLNNGTYKLVVCAKVNGKWDTSDLNKRAVTVTIK